MPLLFLLFCVVPTLLCGLLSNVQAAQWKTLNDGTLHHTVAYDEESLCLTPQGRLEIWVRMTPHGEAERKRAVKKYKEKRYHSHLKLYEIDCQEQTARLRLIDILEVSGARLKRLPGDSDPKLILPGTALDYVAQHSCPHMDEDNGETNSLTELSQEDEPYTNDDKMISSDKLQQIENLQRITATKAATAETWKELGNIYFDTDQAELAINAYEHALALQPNDSDILTDLGTMYRQIGDLQRALANFEKAYFIDPRNLESLYNGAYVYAFDLNNSPKALVMWRRYLELEPGSERAGQVRLFINHYK